MPKPTDPENIPFELVPTITLPTWKGINRQGGAAAIHDYELRHAVNIRPTDDGYRERGGQGKFITSPVGSIEGIFEFGDLGAPHGGPLWPEYGAPYAPNCVPPACTQGPSSGEGVTKFYYGPHGSGWVACPCSGLPGDRSTYAFYDPDKSGSMNAGTFTFPLQSGIGVPGVQGMHHGRLVYFDGALYFITSDAPTGGGGCAHEAGTWLARYQKVTGVTSADPVAILTPSSGHHPADALVLNGELWFTVDEGLYGGAPGGGDSYVWKFGAEGFELMYTTPSAADFPAAAGYLHLMLGTDGTKVYAGLTADKTNNMWMNRVRNVTDGVDITIGVDFSVGIPKGVVGGGAVYTGPHTLGPWVASYGGETYFAGNSKTAGGVIYKIDSLGVVTLERTISLVADPKNCSVTQLFVHGGDLYYVIWGSGIPLELQLGKFNGSVWDDAHVVFPTNAPIPTQMTTFRGDIVLMGTDLVGGAGPRAIKANGGLTSWSQFIPGSGGTCVPANYNQGVEA